MDLQKISSNFKRDIRFFQSYLEKELKSKKCKVKTDLNFRFDEESKEISFSYAVSLQESKTTQFFDVVVNFPHGSAYVTCKNKMLGWVGEPAVAADVIITHLNSLGESVNESIADTSGNYEITLLLDGTEMSFSVVDLQKKREEEYIISGTYHDKDVLALAGKIGVKPIYHKNQDEIALIATGEKAEQLYSLLKKVYGNKIK